MYTLIPTGYRALLESAVSGHRIHTTEGKKAWRNWCETSQLQVFSMQQCQKPQTESRHSVLRASCSFVSSRLQLQLPYTAFW